MAYWCFRTGKGAPRWALAVGAPLLVIAVWALFVSPQPDVQLPRPVHLVIEFAVFGAAAAALAASGLRTWRSCSRWPRSSAEP